MKKPKSSPVSAPADTEDDFDLSSFFPYETWVYYKYVHEAIAKVYLDDFGMKPYEWRTLANLGFSNCYTPAQLAAYTSMDKVSVSRAIANLSKRGWIETRINQEDGRSRIVRSSAEGKRFFAQLIPEMREVEAELLGKLTQEEQSELRRLLKKVSA